MPLPELGRHVTGNYAYVRSSSFYTPQSAQFTRQLGAGLAGALNF